MYKLVYIHVVYVVRLPHIDIFFFTNGTPFLFAILSMYWRCAVSMYFTAVEIGNHIDVSCVDILNEMLQETRRPSTHKS